MYNMSYLLDSEGICSMYDSEGWLKDGSSVYWEISFSGISK